jgi:hypothetical protein
MDLIGKSNGWFINVQTVNLALDSKTGLLVSRPLPAAETFHCEESKCGFVVD